MQLNLFVANILFASSGTAVLFENVDKAKFDSFLKEKGTIFVAFTSPALETLIPFNDVFREAALTTELPFAQVDCDKEIDWCREYGVNGYPAIRHYKRREKVELDEGEIEMNRYRGRKTKNALRTFARRLDLPVLTQVEPTELSSFKRTDDVVIIAYLQSGLEELLEIIGDLAVKNRGQYSFGFVIDSSVAASERQAVPSIVCYRNTDGESVSFQGPFIRDEVDMFLESATKTIIGEVTERSIDEYMARDKLSVYIFASSEEDITDLRHELTPLAKKYTSFVKFGVADAEEFRPMAESFGLSAGNFPAVAVHAPLNDHAFAYRQDRKIVASVVEDMLTTILHGKAVNGQVFGDEAPEGDVSQTGDSKPGHDEL